MHRSVKSLLNASIAGSDYSILDEVIKKVSSWRQRLKTLTTRSLQVRSTAMVHAFTNSIRLKALSNVESGESNLSACLSITFIAISLNLKLTASSPIAIFRPKTFSTSFSNVAPYSTSISDSSMSRNLGWELTLAPFGSSGSEFSCC